MARGMHNGAFFFWDDVTRGCARGVTCARQKRWMLEPGSEKKKRMKKLVGRVLTCQPAGVDNQS